MYELNASNDDMVVEHNILKDGVLSSRQQDGVLVGNVELMEFGEIVALPTRVGLHLIGQDLDDMSAGAGARFFMSLHGGFSALPAILAARINDGEKGALVNRVAIGPDQFTVSVVKGGPEVVERIAQNGGSVFREPPAERARHAELTIVLGSEHLFIARDVRSENFIEVLDVMFGPFGL